MSEEIAEDGNMRALLRQSLGSERRKKSGSVNGRKKSERAALVKKSDLRLSHRGKTVQLNVNVEEHWKDWLAKMKRERNLALFEIVEMGLQMARATLEGKDGGATRCVTR